ncbi:MAG TPA: hypothetical protein DCK83_00900 [Gallionellaceae bacterium]|nr:hypothetical protein [Gallionellaceae bacterium]
MQEVARNAAAADVFRLMASEDKGAKFVEDLRNLPDAALTMMGRLSGVPENQLQIFRAMIRNEDNEFTRGLDQVGGLLQPGDVILMTSNQALASAQRALYKNAKSSHVVLVHTDFICIDAVPKKGVSNRIVSEVLADAEPGWRVIRHKSVGQANTDGIMRACTFYLAQPYLILPSKKSATNFAYCSELARKVYRDVGVTNSGIPDKSIIAPAHFDQLADEHAEWMNVTDSARPAIEFCQNYPELVRMITKLFIDGLKLNRQRFEDRTKQLAEIQRLAKAGKITKEQAKEATAQIREIERNMNHTFWDVRRKS